jgi:FkbM family methyltransferase
MDVSEKLSYHKRMLFGQIRARFFRRLRWLRTVRGWQRVATALAGHTGAFTVTNDQIRFSGRLESHVDRQVYLFGGYEIEEIKTFVDRSPGKRVVLDIGANVGTHSLIFARHFQKVLSFDPNSLLWPLFRRNMALNPATNVTLYEVGVSDHSEQVLLYNIPGSNMALATFSAVEQYDQPLQVQGSATAVVLDELLSDEPIDAVKIDVQGFEPQVLRGMRRLLQRHRPLVWVEIADGTLAEIETQRDLRGLFPYPINVHRFSHSPGIIRRKVTLEAYTGENLRAGDYLISAA